MAIYGINFNGTEIPHGVKRKFRARMKLPGAGFHEWHCLKGVAQNMVERDAMLMQAERPGRSIHIEERKTAAGVWYGFYIR
jgi:hypothetical protein